MDKEISKIRAVAFDAFGTLVEITDKRRPYAVIAKAAQMLPARSPMASEVDLADFAAQCGVPWQQMWLTDLVAELASVTPYSEARAVLAQVKALGLRTAVASNLAMPYAAPITEHLGDLIDVECWSFEMGLVKPDAAFYATLCTRLACAPEEVLMIGDTWRCDYAGATTAGLHALHLDRFNRATLEQRALGCVVADLSGVFHSASPLGSHYG